MKQRYVTDNELPEYALLLAGLERINGRGVCGFLFWPKDKTEFGWKGEAYIDPVEYQPVLVRTNMAKKPLAVRTNIPGLGLSTVSCAPAGCGLAAGFVEHGTQDVRAVLLPAVDSTKCGGPSLRKDARLLENRRD